MLSKIFYNSIFAKIFLPKSYSTITLGCFIFIKYQKDFVETNPKLINHENIHVNQWIEHTILSFWIITLLLFLDIFITDKLNAKILYLYIIPIFTFYIMYIFEFIVNYFYYIFNSNNKVYKQKSIWYNAYKKISFEQEAYINEQNTEYLKYRKDFSSYSNFCKNYY